MGLSKKKRRQIENVSFAIEALEEIYPGTIAGAPWWEAQPDMWDREQRKMWDATFELQDKVKDAILRILDPAVAEER